MMFVIKKIKYFLPLGIAITGISGLVYLVVQQNFRMNANDPQIQISEDMAAALGSGQPVNRVVPSGATDISKSLSPFAIVYNDQGQVTASTAVLDGKVPDLPNGVLDFVKSHGQDRITWQPKVGVRSAVVITRYSDKASGYVLVGRSLREVEKREDMLTFQVGAAWFATMLASFLATLIFSDARKK